MAVAGMTSTNIETKTRRVRRQTPELRRQDLLAVTISCLAQLGPRGTTGREICRRAGVSHGLLRHYFSNPDNLLLETYQELCDSFIARFEDELAAGYTDPWKTVDRLFEVHFSDEWSNPDILGAWIAFWALVRNNPDFAAVSADYNARLHALLDQAVGRLPPGPVPPRDIAALVSATMDGLWLDYSLSSDRLPRERALDLARTMLRRLSPP
ncbi:TetR/AcrR family transcriptional regulator [Sphingosinicella soli]|uniref:AcrR family transcriptional regulator n=1 Tax=Sphingosinicella soli TaxID=333708 RepID=A0A7W7B331_9SPHN|nr:TetR family transcriptional regulator C-terminal domain-containing protein [Sphingosinicella soli]MBB4633145.1 AcrR family transcriptional regulator [Sphingosinicella soli]